ncbi:DUF3189 family protein [Thermosediminibacter oceani]|uniref:DUF3189 domain-containing protein n=1 Tax=Thermosediminibacter oceani (strain ATCC BAA-1034 / DSM 16646 / JW/IW-1228P) TaxID=555079 RepID=D9S2W0_THEOJ|nr:DUF3189 family protein [Thermosediminibacter oceani]ADL07737.1 conserved hypothetical protein [Thermosediminibacter oceani DSM 16646]
MRIIYSCYWGSYLAVVAASLHLGLIEEFDLKSILQLPFFGKLPECELGRIYYMGTDNIGRRVYIMGSKKAGRVVERALKGIAGIYDMNSNSVVFADLLPYGNVFYSIGCFLVHRLKLKTLGNAFLILGLKKSFRSIKRFVEEIKEKSE